MSSNSGLEFETVTNIRPSPRMLAKIESVIEEYCRRELEKIVRKIVAEKIEEIVRECIEEKEVVELRKIPRKEAFTQIKAYIDRHQGARTSNIIYDLRLDPDLALSVLEKLREKGKIRSEKV